MADYFSFRSWPLRVIRGLWLTLRTIILVTGAVTLLLVIIAVSAIRHIAETSVKPLPPRFALSINLMDAPKDAEPVASWIQFGAAERPTLLQTIRAIDRAARDDRVTGIDVELGGTCCSLTTAEEIHNALARFHAATGKPITARAMSFDGVDGLGAYDIATAATRIEVSAAGDFGVTGLALQSPFAAALLQKLGVTAQFEHIGAYKTYPQLFTRSEPSQANREMLDSLAGSLYASAIAPIATRLHESPKTIEALVDQAPFGAEHAKRDRLVDSVLPLDVQIGDFGADTVKLRTYIETAPVPPKDATRIALIIARGTIEEPSAAEQPGSIAPQHLVRQLAEAIKNPSIKAILLRLDTPGGTVTGSAMVGAEVATAAAAHKPLIVSMGELDASGGYWISSHGAMLVADPATLTGSIGVLSGKLSFAPLLRHVGVTITGASRGDNANFDSAVKAWTPVQLASVKVMLNHDYERFVAWVASGRHMTPAAVEAVAQGRVWTGVQAKRRGLVDKIGGYHTALLAIRAALHLKPDAPLAIHVARLSLKDLLQDELLRKLAGNNPLGLADLPPELRAAAWAVQLHRLEMFPLVLR